MLDPPSGTVKLAAGVRFPGACSTIYLVIYPRIP